MADVGDNETHTAITETQKFFVGETVAWVDANNKLRFGTVMANSGYTEDDRIRIQHGCGPYNVAMPHRTRVAHLPPN